MSAHGRVSYAFWVGLGALLVMFASMAALIAWRGLSNVQEAERQADLWRYHAEIAALHQDIHGWVNANPDRLLTDPPLDRQDMLDYYEDISRSQSHNLFLLDNTHKSPELRGALLTLRDRSHAHMIAVKLIIQRSFSDPQEVEQILEELGGMYARFEESLQHSQDTLAQEIAQREAQAKAVAWILQIIIGVCLVIFLGSMMWFFWARLR